MQLGTKKGHLSTSFLVVLSFFTSFSYSLAATSFQDMNDAHSLAAKSKVSKDYLADEKTPVWVTHEQDIYSRLPHEIIKQVVNHWFQDFKNVSDGNDMLHASPTDVTIIKGEGSISKTNPRIRLNTIYLPCEDDAIYKNIMRPIPRDGVIDVYRYYRGQYDQIPGWTSRNHVAHPTILVVMDYKHLMPALDTPESTTKYILYAVAFWNNVNIRLRRIKNPKIAIRIGGIVIGNNRDISEESFRYMDPDVYKNGEIIPAMSEYWNNNKSHHENIAMCNFHIVVHMADFTESEFNERQDMIRRGISESANPPCPGKNRAKSILLWESVHFDGVESAVRKMADVLGDSIPDEWNISKRQYRTTWPIIRDANKKSIEDFLSHASCYAEPKTFYPPEKPIRTILPGQLTPAYEQCEIHFPETLPVDMSTCTDVMCEFVDGTIATIGPALDGTACDRTKKKVGVCLEGKCVRNKWTPI